MAADAPVPRSSSALRVSSERTEATAGETLIVAIVGRPNVGKSSLFNAMVGRREAIVSDVSGTTRDRVTGEVSHQGGRFLLVDTGGLVPEPETEMEAHVAAQVDAALAGADAVLFVADAAQGATLSDRAVAERLRRSGKPVILAANKVDNPRQEALAHEFHELALGDPIPVSAYHRVGVADVVEAVAAALPPDTDTPQAQGGAPRFAIVGRPNVGKSSIANAMLGAERSIVSAVPGTTRDAIDTPFERGGRQGVLIDTAGIRRRGAVEQGIERYSVLRAVRAIDRCDVAIVALDAAEPATAQDLHVAGQVMQSFKGAVVALNKTDLLSEEAAEDNARGLRRAVLARLHFMPYVPVVATSAATGAGLDRLLDVAFEVHEERAKWVEPRALTRVVMDAAARHLPPKHGRRALKLYRVKQESSSPPTFVFYCNNPSLMHFSYERYLENSLRAAFGFTGTHLRLEFRGKGRVHVIGGHRTRQDALPGKRRPQ
ncbi:MAG: ribosome biogenesis GTPase Der [Chloroflexota bacterium]|nr:ribosome biogenesis GTPase Der [Chloroflexota bacterium]